MVMRIGFANGCFDAFHDGHRYFLREARKRCDWLIVAVNTDASVLRLKGVGRPSEGLSDRMMRVNTFADSCIPFDGRVADLIRSIKPDVLFRGQDQEFNGYKWAGGLEIIGRLPGFSTTATLKANETQSHEGVSP